MVWPNISRPYMCPMISSSRWAHSWVVRVGPNDWSGPFVLVTLKGNERMPGMYLGSFSGTPACLHNIVIRPPKAYLRPRWTRAFLIEALRTALMLMSMPDIEAYTRQALSHVISMKCRLRIKLCMKIFNHILVSLFIWGNRKEMWFLLNLCLVHRAVDWGPAKMCHISWYGAGSIARLRGKRATQKSWVFDLWPKGTGWPQYPSHSRSASRRRVGGSHRTPQPCWGCTSEGLRTWAP